MILQSISAAVLKIPFKSAFKHASAERSATETLWVEAKSACGGVGNGEGCPRGYVTGESLASAQAFVERYRSEWISRIVDMEALARWITEHCDDIDANPAAWCAVELAVLDLLGKETGESVEALLGLPELAGSFRYTAVLSDSPQAAFEAQLAVYQKTGFRDFKIKLSGDGERDLAKVKALAAAGIPAERVRADANNLWRDPDEAIAFLQKLDYRFCAIEEPLHAGDYAGMRRIARALDRAIILDESLLHAAQLDSLDDSAVWVPNVRVSKMGGLLRSMEVIREARRRGLKVIIGAHVGETSLLTRAALTVAHSAGDIVLAQEGAFGTYLLAYDVVDPPIMLGARGTLDTKTLGTAGTAGFGLSVKPVA